MCERGTGNILKWIHANSNKNANPHGNITNESAEFTLLLQHYPISQLAFSRTSIKYFGRLETIVLSKWENHHLYGI